MIEDYINYVSIKRKELGGHAICPYAKAFKKNTNIIQSNNLMYTAFDCLKNKKHPKLYLIFGDPIKHDLIWLNQFCLAYEKYAKSLDLWLIWDHPNQINKINGLKTNNNEYAILLIQPLAELNFYSKKLHKTNYYEFWDKKYYNNIVKSRQ